MESAISVQKLNKFFGTRHVVKDLTMDIKHGEIFGFLGPNGSGKTTSIRMMCGLLTPDSGSGTCLGYDIVKDSYVIKKQIGYMTQRFSFWDDLSIKENLRFVADMYKLDNPKQRVDEALDTLGLSSRQNQLAGTLSGGWKQRMALSACMLHEPKVLLLDEPTAGVDPSGRKDFWEELHKLAATGISVLVSTHYMDEAERCHKLAYIAYGALLTMGTKDEILHKYGLSTWIITGTGLDKVKTYAEAIKGVEQSALFGSSLHITGADGVALAQAAEALSKQFSVKAEPTETELEDLFIYLMRNAEDNP